jgi:phage gp29-like protein
MKVNGYSREVWPKFVPADIEKEDVKGFCDNVYKLIGVGALIPDDEVNKRIHELLNIPLSLTGESGKDVITPLSMLEDKLDNEKKKTETGFGKQPAVAPNGKKNPGIEGKAK